MSIHPTAIIAETATVGEGCEIGAYAFVKDGAVIGSNCKLSAHSIIREGAQLGNHVFVDSFAVIGGEPQAVNFDRNIKSRVVIGNNVIIREGVTVHRPATEGAFTIVSYNFV